MTNDLTAEEREKFKDEAQVAKERGSWWDTPDPDKVLRLIKQVEAGVERERKLCEEIQWWIDHNNEHEKGGEGWTGKKCSNCNGTGEVPHSDRRCGMCGGTGEGYEQDKKGEGA